MNKKIKPLAAEIAAVPIDYDAMMQANLTRVFNERDPSCRLHAIRELYNADAQLHEPQGSVQGHEAISQAVTDLLGFLPANFTFTPVRPAVGHNSFIGRKTGQPGGSLQYSTQFNRWNSTIRNVPDACVAKPHLCPASRFERCLDSRRLHHK